MTRIRSRGYDWFGWLDAGSKDLEREAPRVKRMLAATALVFGLASRRLEITHDYCLNLWRSRPAIVVVLEEPSHTSLAGRIDAMFPF